MHAFTGSGSALDLRTGVTSRFAAFVLTLGMASVTAAQAVAPADSADPDGRPDRPVFRSSVDLVSVSAVVRDQKGRLVKDLRRDDFEVFDDGVRRPIVDFAPADDGPISVAIVFDTSGSMRVDHNLEAGREAVESILALLRLGIDEVAFYAFDRSVHVTTGFTTSPEAVRAAVEKVMPFGVTALYDSVGEVAAALEERSHRRRAIVLVTDGLDTASRRSAAEVSGIASASDVPIYVVLVGSTTSDTVSDDAHGAFAFDATTPTAHLGNLAYWTGGSLFHARGSVPAVNAARTLLTELRHQYLLAFESAGPGWRPVDVRLRRGQVTVRTRAAYQSSRPNS